LCRSLRAGFFDGEMGEREIGQCHAAEAEAAAGRRRAVRRQAPVMSWPKATVVTGLPAAS
jgi:hypothetical protein